MRSIAQRSSRADGRASTRARARAPQLHVALVGRLLGPLGRGQGQAVGSHLGHDRPAASDTEAQVVGHVAAAPGHDLVERFGDAALVEQHQLITGESVGAAEGVVGGGGGSADHGTGVRDERANVASLSDRSAAHRARARLARLLLVRPTMSAMPATWPTAVTACLPNWKKNARRSAIVDVATRGAWGHRGTAGATSP